MSVVPFAQAQQLEHLIFLAGKMHAGTVHLDRLGIEIDHQLAGLDHRLGMPLGAAHDRVNAGDELVLVERLGQVVVGTDAEALHFILGAGEARQDQDRRLDLGDAQGTQHLEPGHVGEIEVEQNDVVVVQFSEVDAFLAKVGRIDVETLRLQHQLDRLSRGSVVLNQQYAHAQSPVIPASG